VTLAQSPERALSLQADARASKSAAAVRTRWLGSARRA
jgi:hypothetical protein